MKIIADENIPYAKEAFADLVKVTTLPGRQRWGFGGSTPSRISVDYQARRLWSAAGVRVA